MVSIRLQWISGNREAKKHFYRTYSITFFSLHQHARAYNSKLMHQFNEKLISVPSQYEELRLGVFSELPMHFCIDFCVVVYKGISDLLPSWKVDCLDRIQFLV